jgi:hypothetical protein
MKKILLTAALGVASLGNADAQLALQNFNSATFPAGWTRIKVDNNTPTGIQTWMITGLTTNAWILRSRGTGDSCLLTTSLFSPAGQADRWVVTPAFNVTSPNMVISWEDAEGVAGGNDLMEVWVSPTAGNTVSSFTQMPYQASVTPMVNGAATFGKHGTQLGAYNGQNITVAFRNHSTNQGTSRLDNVQTEVIANTIDGAVNAITFPKIVGATSSTPVNVTIKNLGYNTITSLSLNYAVDGGTPVQQNFSSLSVTPFGSTTLTFTTPIVNPAIAGHSLAVNILQVNGAADPITTNNQMTKAFTVPTQTVPRAGLIEELSSSTCPPCSTFNAVFDPLAFAQNANVPSSNFNVIKYQMNWPGAGNDASYNNDGLTRRTFYGTNGIPEHFTNGAPGGAGDLAEINASKASPAYATITGTYIVDPSSSSAGTISGSVSVTPHFSITGNYKIHIALVERFYQNTANTTGQLDYRYVMRRMIPSGNGTTVSSWTSGTPQVINITSSPYTVGSVAQMNTNMWGSPIGSDLVVFIQDNDDNSILQSKVIPAQWPTDVATIANETKVMIAPNPATDFAVVALDMASAANVTIHVTDALGRIVHTTTQQLSAGRNDIGINTSEFSTGLYNVTIQTEKGSITERLSVVK